VLGPVVASVAVVFLIEHYAVEARGHGAPEVMDAIYYKKGFIRPIVAAIKALASGLSIGSGGSVGREGPMIQIGAAMASWGGRGVRVSRWQLITLVAAGGGGGIAATFNTPIAGVLFAVEILLHEISVRTLVPAVLSISTATFVGQLVLGNHPALEIPPLHMATSTGAILLPAFLGLGVLTALIGALFIKALYGVEDQLEHRLRNPYLRHAAGMLGVGVTMVVLFRLTGAYHVEGVGYATMMDILDGRMTGVALLLALFVLKLGTTSLTLGSGASGGVFSPSLFMGATAGGACGLVLDHLFPGLHVDPAALALAGMAGVVASATGAALTAIVMIFEMTLDYSIVLPMTVTVSVAYGLRRLILADSIYTMRLTRRGHVMPQALQANAHMVHHVGDLVMADVVVVPPSTPPGDLPLSSAADAPCYAVLLDRDTVVGAMSCAWALGHRDELTAAATCGEIAPRDFVVVPSDMTLFDLLDRMQKTRAEVAVVVAVAPDEPRVADGGAVRGVVTKAHLAEAIAEGMELFED